MKKVFISLLFITGFGGYVAYTYLSTNTAQAVASVTSPSTGTATDTTAPVSAPPPVPVVPAPTPLAITTVVVTNPKTDMYKNGTYTGSVADAYYGNIQVKAVITGGKLTNVVFLQYPNDRQVSVQINEQAMPVLKSEAIKAQSSKVSGVSGASDSSTAFRESLAAALAKAAT